MKRTLRISTLLGLLSVICAVAFSPASVWASEEERIAEGVYIGSIDVGGMTEQEAADAVNAYVENAGEYVFTLTAGESRVQVKASELAVSFTDMNAVQEAMDVGKSGNLIKR